jgi:hypothetical protein
MVPSSAAGRFTWMWEVAMGDRGIVDQFGSDSVPRGYEWMNEPSWTLSEAGVEITPPAPGDLFCPPDGSTPSLNPSLLSTVVTGDFTAVARVRGTLVGFGDAAAITVYHSPTLWAKLCMERSPHGDISIVSVVTRDVSDDSNGELLDNPSCWLRLTRHGSVFGMHHSIDGDRWRFARTFRLDVPAGVRVGLQAQAPFVAGCSVVFEHFSIQPGAVADFRSGE